MQLVLGVAMASGFVFYFVVFLMKLLHWLYDKEVAGSSPHPLGCSAHLPERREGASPEMEATGQASVLWWHSLREGGTGTCEWGFWRPG